MSLINITNIQLDNNPDLFLSPIKMHVTFECLLDISEEDVLGKNKLLFFKILINFI